MSKRALRKQRHIPEFSKHLQTFAEKVWLGSLAKNLKDGKITREQAHAMLHERVPHLLGPEHNHASEEQVIVNDEVVEQEHTHVHSEHCNHG